MKDLILTISLTDHSLNLTIKKHLNVRTGYPVDFPQLCDSLEELQTLLAIAQNQAIPKAPGSPPHCCVCGGVVKSYAAPYHVNPQEICRCPDPPHGMGSSKPLGPAERSPKFTRYGLDPLDDQSLVPLCPVCAKITKGYASQPSHYVLAASQICRCPDSPNNSQTVRNFDQPPVRCSIVDCKSVAIWQDCDSNNLPLQYGRRYCAHHALTNSRGVGSIIPFPST